MLLAAAVPVLAAKCLACHNGEQKVAGLDLSTRATALRVIAPGDAPASKLYQYVSAGKMPPGKPLEAGEVASIRAWIASGAEFEGRLSAARPRAGLDWWALQSPAKASPPRIDGLDNPIDAFVAAKLREKGLDLGPRADHASLIRRLHFDLAGLPPSPEDMREDYAAAVERLLRSPQYGERWGRHWLDVVRFGESDGGEHNHERMTAWKYRDYVIDAINSDKPYTEFVREQVAGDLLKPGDPRATAATGFLVCGPWDSVTKNINRDEMFRKTLRQDELDDMLTTTFQSFQAMTVNCARCHDHKFDPIPQRDYHRIAAAFRGVTFGERDITTEQARKDRSAVLAPLLKEERRIRDALAEIEDEPRARLLLAKIQAAELPRGVGAKHIQTNAVFNRNKFAPVRSARFRFVVTSQQGNVAPKVDRLELLPAGKVVEGWRGDKSATDDAPQILEIALDAESAVDEIRWSTDRVRGNKDGSIRVYRLEYRTASGEWKIAGELLDHEVPAEVAMVAVSDAELDQALSADARAKRAELAAAMKDAKARIDAVPPLETVHAAKPEPAMLPEHILERGSVAMPKDPVTPGVLSAIRQLAPDLPAGGDSERRMALANWLADVRNPLTARVIVNRVWQQHFGAGIVNTPSDFGFNGDRPSHPELLDWLALEFMEHGWSLKWLHRQILSSRVFQQSSRMDPKAHAIDSGNRLLWRMPPRRMDAETLRDSILAVSGTLNPERGGPSFALQKKETGGSYLYRALANDGPPVWRRSVYKFVARGGERVFMDSFDCPDPAVATPQRSSSNTPVQALTLLNNQFVLRQAGMLARRLEREAGASRPAQVHRAHQLLFGRAATPAERDMGAKFADQHGLDLYCRALLNSNEFVYVP
jgi:hypothetical protein